MIAVPVTENDDPPFTAQVARNIWAGVIQRAVFDYRQKQSVQDRADAQEWLFSDDREFPSFLAICDELDLDPDAIRGRLNGHELRSG